MLHSEKDFFHFYTLLSILQEVMVPSLYRWVNTIYVELVKENILVNVIKGFAGSLHNFSDHQLLCRSDIKFPEVQRLSSCQTDWNPHSDMFLSYGLQGIVQTF